MLGLVAAAAFLLGPHADAASPAPHVLVQLAPAAACSGAAPLLRAGATVVSAELRLYRVPAAAAPRLEAQLRARHALAAAGPDRPLPQAAVQDAQPDPLEPDEWWRSAIGIDGLTPPGPGIPVTIVDSGVDLQHPEFLGRPDTVPLNPQEPAPLGGQHGTAVASLVGAPRNGVGIVGVYPQAVIRSWDTALGAGTQIETSEVVKGILAAADDGPGVINLSLGSTNRDAFVEQAIDRAWAKGSLVVVAAGNDGDQGNPAVYPADYPHVLTVAATDRSGAVAPFSSRSPAVDLAAPGQDVTVATARDGSWNALSGTSFATPIVSGAAAWVWTARPQLDNSQLFEVIRRSATDIGPPGRDDASGWGLLNVRSALSYPAPVRDPLEPNDDVQFVRPGGTFSSGFAPLTTAARPTATLQARVDRVEDPRDVYRIRVPARRRVTVSAASTAPLALRVWGPTTVSVSTAGAGQLLGRDVRLRGGARKVVVDGGASGRWAYVDVSLAGRKGLFATYSLSVAPAP